jgi:hypothetical protein
VEDMMESLNQKIILVPDVLVTTTGKIFKKTTKEDVYRVKKAVNYVADKFYRKNEVDNLIESGITIEIVDK